MGEVVKCYPDDLTRLPTRRARCICGRGSSGALTAHPRLAQRRSLPFWSPFAPRPESSGRHSLLHYTVEASLSPNGRWPTLPGWPANAGCRPSGPHACSHLCAHWRLRRGSAKHSRRSRADEAYIKTSGAGPYPLMYYRTICTSGDRQ
jgi:hypothetical protein